jgi:hypothetical protein
MRQKNFARWVRGCRDTFGIESYVVGKMVYDALTGVNFYLNRLQRRPDQMKNICFAGFSGKNCAMQFVDSAAKKVFHDCHGTS